MKPDGSIDETVARIRASKSMPEEKVDRVLTSCKSEGMLSAAFFAP